MKLHKTIILTCPLLIIVCLCIGLRANTDNHTPLITEQTKPLEYVKLGEYTITAYCPCEKCCGVWGENRPVDEYGNRIVYTASGEEAIQGVTIAADVSILPFGTKLYVDGHPYIVQDRGGGIKGNRLDIYFKSHEAALSFGVQTKEVMVEMARSYKD